MAILATRRRWLVTRRWAASGSSCSCQRLASMNSSSLASIGNLRISDRYRLSPPSGDITASALAAMLHPLTYSRTLGPARPDAHRPTTPFNLSDRYGVAVAVGSLGGRPEKSDCSGWFSTPRAVHQ